MIIDLSHTIEAGMTTFPGLPGPQIVPHLTRENSGAAERGVGADAFAAQTVRGAAVLVHTGWDRHWRTPEYGVAAPHLTAQAAAYLRDEGAALVGIDAVNVDDMQSGGERPAHSILLGAGIPVLEHLTGLDRLPPTGARLHAVPPKVRGFTSFPVRAYAVVP